MNGATQAHQHVDGAHTELAAIVEARFARSISVPSAFFEAEAGRIAEACWAMAKRFHAGGRLLAFGIGAAATDAQHVAVEFVHPVIVGKRALPALALTNNSASLSARRHNSPGDPFAPQLRLLARPQDMALGFASDADSANVAAALVQARQQGLLTIGMGAAAYADLAESALDFAFIVPSSDPLVVQETHETLYHILWELVHVYFEHEGLLR